MGMLTKVKGGISPQQLFMISVLVVNGGNYLYNLLLGRFLGPKAFADAALLVTLLLVLSFLGMTFQLVTAKFTAEYSGRVWTVFRQRMSLYALLLGTLLGGLLLFLAPLLQQLLHTESPYVFYIFALGVPLYFLMSVSRGQYQGQESFVKLSLSYQFEMWGRLLITFVALLLVRESFGSMVALGIFGSLVLGLYPFKKLRLVRVRNFQSPVLDVAKIRNFMLVTASYELTQILINNSDILLVKHFFEPTEAGLYSSLALIGRVVYFVAWMFVMLLLPTVVRHKKEGRPTKPILFQYVLYVGILSVCIVSICALFPEPIIQILFGKAYISMAGLLWQYALATSLFAVANIFTYYFLSLDHYAPIWISGIMGLSQIFLVYFYHSSLAMVVQVQIIAMALLLVAQLLYFDSKKV